MNLYLMLKHPREMVDFEDNSWLVTKIEKISIRDGEPNHIEVGGIMENDKRRKSSLVNWFDVPKDVKEQVAYALSREAAELTQATANILAELSVL